MKKSIKTALIVAFALILAGAAAIGVYIGLNHDRSFGEMFENTVAESYETTTKDIVGDFDRIAITDNDAEIKLLPSGDGKARIEYSVVEDRDYIITVSDGVLDIRVDDDRSSFFNFTYRKIVLNVCLPDSEYESLTVDCTSGSVEVPEGFTFAETDIETSSGSVDLKANVTGTADINTTSGAIRLDNLKPQSLTAESTSGSVKVNDAGAQDARIMTTSGSAKINGGEFGSLEVNSSSGSIRVEGITAAKISAEASSGSVTLTRCAVSGEARVKTSSGSIELASCTAGSIDAEASSGKITLDGTVASGLAELSNSSGGVRLTGADAGELRINTTSGSVRGSLLSGKMFDVRTGSGSEDVPASDRDGGMCVIETGSGSVSITIAE